MAAASWYLLKASLALSLRNGFLKQMNELAWYRCRALG
jgi:hypothetical protein